MGGGGHISAEYWAIYVFELFHVINVAAAFSITFKQNA